jgi:hypothetical protein
MASVRPQNIPQWHFPTRDDRHETRLRVAASRRLIAESEFLLRHAPECVVGDLQAERL